MTDPNDTTARRIIDLETTTKLQEEFVEVLHQRLVAAHAYIETLKQQLAGLEKQPAEPPTELWRRLGRLQDRRGERQDQRGQAQDKRDQQPVPSGR